MIRVVWNSAWSGRKGIHTMKKFLFDCRAKRHSLLVVVFTILAAGAGWAVAASGPQLPSSGQPALAGLIEAGTLEDLRWPNFSDYRDDAKSFYAPSNYALAWLQNGRGTASAMAVIKVLEQADQVGLIPEDYDGPRWKDRLAQLSGANLPVPEDQQARFDLALTVSLMRYVFDVQFGRVKPRRVRLGDDDARSRFDLPKFMRERIVNAQDVAGELSQLEPPYVLYRRTEETLRKYMQMAAQDAGEKLPPGPKKTIDPGDDYPGVPRLVRLLKLVGDLPPDAALAPDSTLYQAPLVDAVKRFQQRHALAPDGRIGKDTLEQLNTPLSDRVRQLQFTLERWRWAPRVYNPPPILVNIPEFILRGFGPGETIELTMRVVVGRSYRAHTPVFAQEMSYLVFRPYWNVPPAIQHGEIVPKLKKDPDYLKKNELEVVDGQEKVVSTGPVSAEQLAQLSTGALSVRQRPGPKNSLGLAKFVFPNEHNVYLHSTPSQELFSRTRRDFSHGCIRVEDPAELAAWILRGNAGWTKDKITAAMTSGPDSQQVNLAQKRPVVIIYATAVVLPDGTVKFFQDIYGHDARLEKALARGFPRARGEAATSAVPAPGPRERN
jgi:murein L,D-transpeptidase YcbB/YkuD